MKQFILLPIGDQNPNEYKRDLKNGICEILKLLFQTCNLDLNEDETFAFYTLTKLLQDIREAEEDSFTVINLLSYPNPKP